MYEVGQQIGSLIIAESLGAYARVVCMGCNASTIRRTYDLARVVRGERKSCRCQLRNVQTGLSPGLHMWMQKYIRGAVKRNLSWSIEPIDFVAIVTKECYYCGTSPEVRRDRQIEFNASGIDRLDPTIGYESYNVVPSCSLCNYAKQSLTAEQFLALVDKIHAYKEADNDTVVYTYLTAG